MKINFAKLNHALIPTTKEGRDRFRRSFLGKLTRPLGAMYSALSEEGRLLAALSLLAGGLGLDVQSTYAYQVWCWLTAVLLGSLLLHLLILLLFGIGLHFRRPAVAAPGTRTGGPMT